MLRKTKVVVKPEGNRVRTEEGREQNANLYTALTLVRHHAQGLKHTIPFLSNP